MESDQAAARAAAILNACWMVRHYRRAVSREQRAQAILLLAATMRAALNESAESDAEALLYALAVGLHDPADKRFSV